jgi:2-amino-4-hydroxy-6-hydroxymethyldihydropteridine diphosphokinase
MSSGRSAPVEQMDRTAPSTRVPSDCEAWIGFGANLGDRLGSIQRALSFFEPCVEAVSPIFETAPWGVLDQPWFLNGVARLHWTSGPESLLARCLSIEQELGRTRGERNGPRTIDLDVLLLGPCAYSVPGLSIPHPGIASRRSVLEPWAALSPDLIVPGLTDSIGTLCIRAKALGGQEVRSFELPA